MLTPERIVVSAALVIVLILAYRQHETSLIERGRHEVQLQWDHEKQARALAESAAVLTRIKNNERQAEQQALKNEKLKNDYEKEITSVRRIAVVRGRMRISENICAGFAKRAEASDTGGGDAGAATTRILPEPYARDIDALMLEADLMLASCRVGQAFIKANGFTP